MSGLGTTNLMKPSNKVLYQQNVPVIVGLSVMELIDGFLLFMVIKSSWSSYNVNRRNVSLWQFVKSIPFMKKLYLASGGMIFFFNTLFLAVEILPINYDDHLCSLNYHVLGGIRFYSCLISIYTYYWARQYLLNSSPVLRTVIPKWFYIVSKTSLAASLIGFTYPIVSILYQTSILFEKSPEDLPAEMKGNDCYGLAKNTAIGRILTAIGTLVSVQILYVFLFFKTLRFQEEANRNAARENNGNLTRLAKRCFVTAAITMVTDSSALIMVGFLPLQTVTYLNLISQIDLTLNMMTMIFCFQSVPEFMAQVKETVCFNCCKKQNEEALPPNPGRAAVA